MPPLPDLAMKISRTAAPHEGGAGEMVIIIQRPYAHLEKELRRTFGNGNKTRVIIDRRMGERRGRGEAVAEDRRWRDRRAHKEQLLEVVINP
ncbi:MAG: hypothetical protein ACQEQ7_06815 [Thermodesulfobacteriota bacterium]